MATLTDLARQAVQVPLRVVASATDGDRGLDDLRQQLRGDIREVVRTELAAAIAPLARDDTSQDLESVRTSVTALGADLDDLRQRLAAIEARLAEVHDDVQHIRTQQASARAKKKPTG